MNKDIYSVLDNKYLVTGEYKAVDTSSIAELRDKLSELEGLGLSSSLNYHKCKNLLNSIYSNPIAKYSKLHEMASCILTKLSECENTSSIKMYVMTFDDLYDNLLYKYGLEINLLSNYIGSLPEMVIKRMKLVGSEEVLRTIDMHDFGYINEMEVELIHHDNKLLDRLSRIPISYQDELVVNTSGYDSISNMYISKATTYTKYSWLAIGDGANFDSNESCRLYTNIYSRKDRNYDDSFKSCDPLLCKFTEGGLIIFKL